jgi:Na+-driven multidrug efflux pump
MAAINNMLRKYSALDAVFSKEEYAQIPMAVVGIVMKFFQIVISIVVGMAAGCIPIVGFNMGAGLKDRVKKLFTRLLLCEAAVGVVSFLIVELLPGQLIALFGAGNESVYYTEFAVRAFRTYLCMIIFACVNKATFIFLQAMGKAAISTGLSMIREIVFGVGFALLLPVFFGLDGVLYSMPVSDILTAVVSAVIIFMTYRELGAK